VVCHQTPHPVVTHVTIPPPPPPPSSSPEDGGGSPHQPEKTLPKPLSCIQRGAAWRMAAGVENQTTPPSQRTAVGVQLSLNCAMNFSCLGVLKPHPEDVRLFSLTCRAQSVSSKSVIERARNGGACRFCPRSSSPEISPSNFPFSISCATPFSHAPYTKRFSRVSPARIRRPTASGRARIDRSNFPRAVQPASHISAFRPVYLKKAFGFKRWIAGAVPVAPPSPREPR